MRNITWMKYLCGAHVLKYILFINEVAIHFEIVVVECFIH